MASIHCERVAEGVSCIVHFVPARCLDPIPILYSQSDCVTIDTDYCLCLTSRVCLFTADSGDLMSIILQVENLSLARDASRTYGVVA